MDTKSYWMDSAALPRFGKLNGDKKVDVVVVGAGITGITAAYLLKKAGKRVALLEKDRCVSGDTAVTTAHLTCVMDTRLPELVKTFGEDHARAAWDAGMAGIEMIERCVGETGSACEFRRVPGFLHGSILQGAREEREELEQEARMAAALGFEVGFVEEIPIFKRAAMRVANQAKFHPALYLRSLLQAIEGDGSFVCEQSEVTEFSEKPLAVKVGHFAVRCGKIVIATHVPLMGNNGLISATLFQSKLAPYSSYALGGRVEGGRLPEANFWDTSDPYFYTRVDSHRGFQYVIFGGEDHKTGQVEDTEEIYKRLENRLKIFLPEVRVDHRWSGQVVETNDGLPLMGELGEGQFVATGFSGNGMTFGTMGAMMACDWATGKKNPWAELFDVHRKKVIGGTWDYIKENLDYPFYFLKDRLLRGDHSGVESVGRGEGKVLTREGKRVAVCRDEKGKLHVVSAICTHMGCVVRWNGAERTWDCPCHGSRFGCSGEVIAGPAEERLGKADAGE